MTPSSDLKPRDQDNLDLSSTQDAEEAMWNEIPDDVEMSLFEHLEELRQRIFYALIAIVIGVIGCFTVVKHIVQLLEIPAQGAKFLQLSPGNIFSFPSKWRDTAEFCLPVPSSSIKSSSSCCPVSPGGSDV